MAVFHISANDTDMGDYEANSAAEALDAYARDAGYKNYAEVVAQYGDDATATQLDIGALCEAVQAETGFAVFQDSYGSGVSLVNGVSYDTYQDLAQSIGRNCWEFKA